mmetsp:Transcript_11146/g.41639  ORF Transcript_11146/g.41639 Transcript_11146/m.41639 type:complete len:351 (-) Transcript_11146:63-1115(-)
MPNFSLRILKSTSNSPFVNLATEYFLFNQKAVMQPTLYLWRNSSCVVIGKNQNPWKECHISKMEEDNVHLVRRHSGGGAVYQDEGNSIYTFLMPKDRYNKDKNFGIIQKALQEYGIGAEVSGRNDMTVNGRKISGSAFKETRDRAIHHGTILLDLDLGALQRYLNPHKLKLQSKGVDSVVSRVQNLKELNPELEHDALCEKLIQQFIQEFGHATDESVPIESVNLQEMQENDQWRKQYNILHDWNFRFARTPQFAYNFETRFDWGMVDVHIDSVNGEVSDIKIFSDTLYPVIVDEFANALKGRQLKRESIMDAAEHVVQHVKESNDYDAGATAVIEKSCYQMADWISQQL